MYKRIGTMILLLVAALFYIARPAAADSVETLIVQEDRPDFVAPLLQTAIAELGYTEEADGRTKYGEWSGDPQAEWCAEFICWCVEQTDQTCDTHMMNVIYPYWSGQNTARDWFITRGRFVFRRGNCPNWGYQWLKGADHLLEKNEYLPRPGDLVFFSYNEYGDTEHVALIEYCTRDADGGVILHVIEGNNPASVQRNQYVLDNSQVLGFGACEDVIGTTMRLGNAGDKVLWLQQSLNTLGFLASKHLTGSYGSNTRKAVLRFQTEYLPDKTATGIADRETQQALAVELETFLYGAPETWLVGE